MGLATDLPPPPPPLPLASLAAVVDAQRTEIASLRYRLAALQESAAAPSAAVCRGRHLYSIQNSRSSIAKHLSHSLSH
jgi:hypothetical protein